MTKNHHYEYEIRILNRPIGGKKVRKCIGKEKAVAVLAGHQERCARQFVPIAVKNVKYRLSRKRENLSTVGNVSESAALDTEVI